MRTVDQNESAIGPGQGRRTLLASAAGSVATASMAALSSAGAAEPPVGCAAVTGSVAWKQPGNNEHMLALQRGASTPSAASVAIDYFGHCAFRITSPAGLTMMFDPWRNDPSGAWGLWFPKEFPHTVVDLALSTHTHFDHDAIDRVDATTVLDRMIGTWSFGDVTVTGIADKHATDNPGFYKWINAVKEAGADPYPPHNPGHLDMVTYVVETGGVRILIWGDNRHDPPDDVWAKWGRIDVLTLPVDGSWHCLSFEQGNAVVDRLKPKVVIPTHYLLPGVSSTLSTLQTADGWVEAQKSKQRLDGSRLLVAPNTVASLDRHFAYFGNHADHG